VTGTTDVSEKEVCFGKIQGSQIYAHHVPKPRDGAQGFSESHWPPIAVTLRRAGSAAALMVAVHDPHGTEFATLDVNTARGIVPLMDKRIIRLVARLMPRPTQGEKVGQSISKHYNILIHMYGKKKMAWGIGKHLSQKLVWLRNPDMVEPGIDVFNPHANLKIAPPTQTITNMAPSGPGYITRTNEEIRNDVIGVFDSLQKSDKLPEMDPPDTVVTKLLSHQKQGLYFMINKESPQGRDAKMGPTSSLWRSKVQNNGMRVYFNVITGKEERSKPSEVLGGILADMMGLGKTLNILSLVMSTFPDADKWAQERPPFPKNGELKLLCNSKATLLVAPLTTIVNWEEQIKQHLKPGSLKVYIYHGNNRLNDIEELATYDLVITTYNIASSELDRRGAKMKRANAVLPLHQTNWFRVVLDEAHMIRDQTTKQSKAICALAAQRRWAVTGTPVQNRLDDLGALIKFLRVEPFHETRGFHQYIMAPFKAADPEILPKLRLLVDSITLRRLKDRIDLPKRTDQLIKLQWSEEERQLYEWFAKDSTNKMNVVAGERQKGLGGKAYVHVLRAILRLRLICAHGRELLSEEDLKLMEGHSKDSAIDLSDEDDEAEKPALTSAQVYGTFDLMKQTGADNCASCARKIAPKETDEESSKNETIAYMMPCYEVICVDCIKQVKEATEQSADSSNHTSCVMCHQWMKVFFFAIKQNNVAENEEAKAKAKLGVRGGKQLGVYSGPHTKVRALVQSLRMNQVESEETYPGERPIKR
jgi:SNF2-related domain